MAADTGALAMVDTVAPVAAAVEDVAIPSLDDVTPETPAEVPAEADAVRAEAGDKTKPADATVTAPATITPKQIVEQLQELKKTNEPLAKAIHSHVKAGLDSQRFLKEVGAKDFTEAKALLSKPDESMEQLRETTETTDRLLYAGGDSHKELIENVLEDLKSELGDKVGPQRLSELGESILAKLKEADLDGHTRITRSAFLAASESSGLIKSLNTLHGLLITGKTAEAQQMLKNIGEFFDAEIKENEAMTAKRTELKVAAEKETTATVTKLRAEAEGWTGPLG
jgi:hypothetical protein